MTDAYDPAVEMTDPAEPPASDGVDEKPRLLVENHNPNLTVDALKAILVNAGGLFQSGQPVRLVHKGNGEAAIEPLTPDALIYHVHQVSRPYVATQKGEQDAPLPLPIARMYLQGLSDWGLPELYGVTSAPLIKADGAIVCDPGYAPEEKMWSLGAPDLMVPLRPSREEAEAALLILRDRFKTFPFQDATMVMTNAGLKVVDLRVPPGLDESCFLVALLTAVARASLLLAPGFLICGPATSGSSAGKGLLTRLICSIAMGISPSAVTTGGRIAELEKRVSSELMRASQVLFLDNVNNVCLSSDLIASIMTERPARVRVLGKSKMVTLCSSALVVITGNGLTVGEDLARRFIPFFIDPAMEDPESRQFEGNIEVEVAKSRSALLSAAVTILRWGRQQTGLPSGRALGSFPDWCSWVRDPLLALGCQDPVERVLENKLRDTGRQHKVEVFTTWWEIHGDTPVKAKELDARIINLIDPKGRSRQLVTSVLQSWDGARIAGFHFTKQDRQAKWSVATYTLCKIETDFSHPSNTADRPGAQCFCPVQDPEPFCPITGELACEAPTDNPEFPPKPLMPDDAEPQKPTTKNWSVRI